MKTTKRKSVETEIMVPVKIRTDEELRITKLAGAFDAEGESHCVRSELGAKFNDTLDTDIAILNWKGKRYVVEIQDFVDAIVKSTEEQ